jgi:DNA-binding MarR family transcriptional regulator
MLSRRHAQKSKRTRKPDLEAEVFVGVLRTADALSRGAEALLKPAGLSGTQYNVLRILQGAGSEGLACSEIGERLISRDPDMTRLLDRMEARGWIARARQQQDRRVVKTRITEDGLRILEELDAPVRELHRRQLNHIPERDLRQLSMLLERAREPGDSGTPDDPE